MKCIIRLYCIVLTVLGITSCNGRQSHTLEEISGMWECDIKEGEFVGEQRLHFAKDNKLNDEKILNYHSYDSGFDFSMDVRVKISGHWKLTGESIYVRYDIDQLETAADKNTFNIIPTKSNADMEKLEKSKYYMCNELGNKLDMYFFSEFNQISGKFLLLGKIVFLNKDSIILENNTNKVLMRRAY